MTTFFAVFNPQRGKNFFSYSGDVDVQKSLFFFTFLSAAEEIFFA